MCIADVLVPATPLLVGGSVALYLKASKRRKLHPPRDTWSVRVEQAKRRHWDYDYDGPSPVNDEIAVRLKKGKEGMTFGVIKIDAPAFEEKIRTLKAQAEERASELNAHIDL